MTGEVGKRPWGTYEVLTESEIRSNGSCTDALQSHQHRAEHWVCHRHTNSENVQKVANEHVYIPLQAEHRLENYTNDLVVLIEVQTGLYLGEDDIIRYEDIYGRD